MTDQTEPLRLLGVEEVARLLGTREAEVHLLLDAGRLPCVRVGASRTPKVSRAMLEAWADAVGRSATTGALGAIRRVRRPA